MVGRMRPFGVGNGDSPTPVCGFLGEAGALNCTPADSEEDALTGYGGGGGGSTAVGCSTCNQQRWVFLLRNPEDREGETFPGSGENAI